MKKIEFSILISLIISILIANFSVFSANCEEVRGEVLRLHILANSDSEEDQNLKLKIRDKILESSASLFEGGKNLEDAKMAAQQNLSKITEIAQNEVYAQGYFYEVSAELGESFFETREYDNVTLPAGIYSALIIKIGKAKGKNWWCVLFPALCIPAAQGEKELSDVLNSLQIDTVTNPVYKPKFAIFELIEKIKNNV